MLRSSLITGALLLLAPAAFHGVYGQMPVEDWTDRPDAHAPIGISNDFVPAPGSLELRYRFAVRDHDGFLMGTTEVPGLAIFTMGWEMAPVSMSIQEHTVEVRTAVTDWLGFSATVPFHYTSAEFLTVDDEFGSVSASGLGDVEAHVLYGLHDEWPYRAHLLAGVLIPTGETDLTGRLPDGAEEQVLPYPMQPGFGVFALMPGAVFVAENEFGTVGLKAGARIPIGDAEDEWHRGTELSAEVWLAYRFTDWVSASVRMSYLEARRMDGMDPNLDPMSSPMAHPLLQGGKRFDFPIGMNIDFPRGPLAGNRLYGELVVPAHQNLDGPQIRRRFGVTLGWGLRF